MGRGRRSIRKDGGEQENPSRVSLLFAVECTNHSEVGWSSFHCREEHGRASDGPECVLTIRRTERKKHYVEKNIKKASGK
jgi:hypothetical protein